MSFSRHKSPLPSPPPCSSHRRGELAMLVPVTCASYDCSPPLPGGADRWERLDALRRLGRRVKPFDHAGAAGGFVLTSVLVLLVLLRLVPSDNYGLDDLAWSGGGGRQDNIALGPVESEPGQRECDWFEGEWVWDDKYPLYESDGCDFIDEGFRCSQNGRPDQMYTQWRWQPAGCDLPRFDAKKLLEKLRHKRLVFVGDSIGRNQWESILCMLSSAVSNKSTIYEVNNKPITKHTGFLVFRIEDYDCTVEYYRSPFLVPQGRPPAGAPENVKTTLKLDLLDWTSNRWKDADAIVFNTGRWWNYEKTTRGGCYFQEGDQVKMEMSVAGAYERAIQTLFEWIHKEVNRSKTQVIFRTYAPVHYRLGGWRKGGGCHLETLPDSSPITLEQWAEFLKPFKNISSHKSTATELQEVDLLNVTQMSARRRDGHLSLYYLGPSKVAPLRKQDCSHWCLPGVPDAWNELLYAIIMRRDSMMHQNMTHTKNELHPSTI